MTDSFDIVAIEELEPAHVVAVINEAFGRRESLDWYRWKHREGPWGPSIGVAAVDQGGAIGVRLLLPWRFQIGDDTLLAHRATEAATIPRARGRGVFSALNRWMMEQVSTALIFSTPNMQSRTGYLKLGWRVIANVPQRWELPSRAGKNALAVSTDERLHTAWDARSLRWRSDPRCRHDYMVSTTDDSADAAAYYRLLTIHGVRVVAPLGLTGPPQHLPELWNEMLDRTQARLLLRPATHLTPTNTSRLGWRRGKSLVIGWTPSDGVLTTRRPQALDSVPWSAADLEGVM